jgi:predicted PurR-regulated permease PerM
MATRPAETKDDSGSGRIRDAATHTFQAIQWQLIPPLAIALIIGLGTVAIIPLLARPLALLIISITIAQALAPLVALLQKRWGRMPSVVAVYLALFLVFASLGWAVAPSLVAQTTQFIEDLPRIVQEVRSTLASINPGLTGEIRDVGDNLEERIGAVALAVPMGVLTVLLDVLFIVFLSVYWLTGTPELTRFTLSLVPKARREGAGQLLNHMGRAMGGYVRGAVINSLIMGALAFAGLAIIGVPFPAVLGLLTMIGEMVPIIGPILVGVVVVAVSLTQSPELALFAGILFTILQQLEGQILTPNIMQRETRVPAALVLFAIVVGGAIGGLLGIVVAVPTAAALRVLVVELIAPAQRRWSGITGKATS